MGSTSNDHVITKVATMSVHPHGHTGSVGPVDIRIGVSRQPKTVLEWAKGPARIAIRQPDDESNATVILLVFYPDLKIPEYVMEGVVDETTRLHRIGCWRQRSLGLTLYVRNRLIRGLPHPIPLGQWSGASHQHGYLPLAWYTFSKSDRFVTTRAQEKRSPIIQPGDPEFNVPESTP